MYKALDPIGKLLVFILFFTGLPLHAAENLVGHDMRVSLDPENGQMSVIDHLTVPPTIRSLEFSLNRGFAIEMQTNKIHRLRSNFAHHARYRIDLPPGENRLTLTYAGKPRFSGTKSLGQMPQGVLSADGAYLDGNSAWYPVTELAIGSIDLRIEHPQQWRALSVGRLKEAQGVSQWSSRVPHDDLYLVAGPFQRTVRSHGDIDLSVWLLKPDSQLAGRYLDVMGEYIDHYSHLIGDYPFAKFAVVENPWQTGFGMPSFTLLGSRVLRLPFIPYTSLPHEILHNWLGNGIWVDYRKGNWSEGLTAYLADHWMKERRGKGAQHRLKSLQRYTNFAAEGRDSPLLAFVSRHDDTSQSVGYDKSLMFFHMLRRSLGDRAFTAALQHLWQRHRFQRIGFDRAIATLLEQEPDLLRRYRAWIETENVPRLQLGDVQVSHKDGRYQLDLSIDQQSETALEFDLPVLVTLQPGQEAQRTIQRINRRSTKLSLTFDSRPLRLDIDPAFDVLRYLDPSEQAPALNRLLGGSTRLVLPSAAADDVLAAWQRFAKTLQRRYPGLRSISDTALPPGTPAGNLLILGWDNRMFDSVSRELNRGAQQLDASGLQIGSEKYNRQQHALVLVESLVDGSNIGVVAAEDAATIDALTRKLPHYGSFGRMVFERGSAKNLRRDVLSPRQSILSRQLGEETVELVLPAEPVLGGQADAQLHGGH